MRFKSYSQVKIRVPCTRHRIRLWPLCVTGLLILAVVLTKYFAYVPPIWPLNRNFHFPEIPVPFVSVSPLKNVPVARNAWLVSSSSWSEELIDTLTNAGWKIVIVMKGSHNYTRRIKNCVILDDYAQKKLNYKLKDFINDTVAISLGHLYAIEHGAEFIYELGYGYTPIDSNHPRVVQSSHTAALVLSNISQTFFNPVDHFGGNELPNLRHSYVTCKIQTPVVQHEMIFNKESFPQFDVHAPAVVLSNGVYFLYNSPNIFYTWEGFWSLLTIPANGALSDSTFYRNLWTLRLLGLVGQNLGFVPQNTRCDGDDCQKVTQDVGNYSTHEVLVNVLQNWNCNRSGFFDCMKDLGRVMVMEQVWASNANEMIEAWIHDLRTISYKEPQLISRMSHLPCISESHVVNFKPNKLERKSSARRNLMEFCMPEVPMDLPLDVDPTFIFDTLLLVVNFNHAHYNVIHLLDNILKDHFPNLIYCGPEMVKFSLPISYVNTTNTEGFFSYECLLRVMEMGYQVDGYLVMSDDMLLNYWNLTPFDLTKVWAPSIVLNGWKLNRINGSVNFYLWNNTFMGKGQVNQALDEIMDILKGNNIYSSVHQLVVVLEQFWLTRKHVGFGDDTVVYYPVDIYYLPAAYSDLYYHVLQVFRRFDAFVEFSVPTTIESVDVKDIVRISGKYDWSPHRNKESMRYFNDSMIFLHPVKLGLVLKSQTLKRAYCAQYVKKLLNQW